MVSRDQPISPRYTPCILISRIASALLHRVNLQQTNSVDYVVYSRSHAFHDGNKHYEEKIPVQLESNPRFSHLEADVGPLHHRVAAAQYKQYMLQRSLLAQLLRNVLKTTDLTTRQPQQFSVLPICAPFCGSALFCAYAKYNMLKLAETVSHVLVRRWVLSPKLQLSAAFPLRRHRTDRCITWIPFHDCCGILSLRNASNFRDFQPRLPHYSVITARYD